MAVLVLGALLLPGLASARAPGPAAAPSPRSSIEIPPLSPGPACAGSACAAPAAGGPAESWYNVSSVQRISPPPLYGASMVFDPVNNVVVLFGGCGTTACPASAQTWEYTGGAWTNVTSQSAQPPARAFAGFVWDSRDGYGLLFGGRTGNRSLNDTWSFVAGTWSNLSAPTGAPSPRWGASMTFDRSDNFVLLFGGCASPTCPDGDTWSYHGGTWKNLTATAGVPPSPRYGAALAYDQGDGYAFLVDGCNATVCPLNDSYEFSAGKWALGPPAPVPPARAFASLVYDAIENATYLVGGNGTGGPRADTWKWSGGRWANVTTILGPGPSARDALADLATSYVTVGAAAHKWPYLLFFGGDPKGCAPCGGPAASDTWVLEPTLTASGSVLPTVVEVGQPTTFAGKGIGGSPPYQFLWQFGDGTSVVAQNPSHGYPSAATDVATLFVSDLSGAEAHANTTITVVAGPAVTVSVSPKATDIGFAVKFNGTVTGGSAPYTYRWDFGDLATSANLSASHSFLTAGTFAPNLTVTDRVQGLGLGATSVVVHPLPTLTTSASNAAPDPSENVTFTAALASGTAPYSYLWTFGDGYQSTVAAPVHAYPAGGNFTVEVRASDAAGAVRYQNLTIQVSAAPDTGHGGGGFPSTDWILGGAAVVAAILIAIVVVLLILDRRRRRRPQPLAAAAVGQPGWGDDEGGPGPGDERSSRSARRAGRLYPRR